MLFNFAQIYVIASELCVIFKIIQNSESHHLGFIIIANIGYMAYYIQ